MIKIKDIKQILEDHDYVIEHDVSMNDMNVKVIVLHENGNVYYIKFDPERLTDMTADYFLYKFNLVMKYAD